MIISLKGFKVLIFDPNDEAKLKGFSSREIFEAAQILNKAGLKVRVPLQPFRDEPQKTWYIKRLPYNALEEDPAKRIAGINAYSAAMGFGIRRISPLFNAHKVDEGRTQSKLFLTSKQKNQAAKDILSHFRATDAGLRNGFVFLDDINNYVLNMHNDEEFVGTLMNINHRGVDIVVHYHDPMQIPPVLYRFGSIIRFHKTVDRVKKAAKVPYEFLKLAEAIIDEETEHNPRFFLYIDAGEGAILGATSAQFRAGALRFLQSHPSVWKEYGSKESCIDNYLLKFKK